MPPIYMIRGCLYLAAGNLGGLAPPISLLLPFFLSHCSNGEPAALHPATFLLGGRSPPTSTAVPPDGVSGSQVSVTHGAEYSVGLLLPRSGPGVGRVDRQAEEGLGLWTLVSLSSPEAPSLFLLFYHVLTSLLDCKEIQPVNPKGHQS